MVRNLDYFDEQIIEITARHYHTLRDKQITIPAIELIAMAMPFRYLVSSVDPGSECSLLQLTGKGSQPHRSTDLINISLLGHQINDRILAGFIEFGTVGIG